LGIEEMRLLMVPKSFPRNQGQARIPTLHIAMYGHFDRCLECFEPKKMYQSDE
jgi:hypothetical protein